MMLIESGKHAGRYICDHCGKLIPEGKEIKRVDYLDDPGLTLHMCSWAHWDRELFKRYQLPLFGGDG